MKPLFIVTAAAGGREYRHELAKNHLLSQISDYYREKLGLARTYSLERDLEYEMGKLGAAPEHIEGRATGWILLDFGSVLVHLFQKDQREYYNLERLWNDAQQLDISDLLTD